MTPTPKNGTPAPGTRRYRAAVGERSFDVAVGGAGLEVDGVPADAALTHLGDSSYVLRDGHRVFTVVVLREDGHTRVTIDGRDVDVHVLDERALLLERFGIEDAAGAAEREIRAPMPGLVLKLLVEPGQDVEPGDGLAVLEAMKMENELRATSAGRVAAVHVAEGDAVTKGALLIELEA